jgi:hypothetical protein
VARQFLIALFGLLTLASGCGQSATQAPVAPSRTADHETRAPRRNDRPRPRLIAPPPAYGNKVVMAKSTTERDALN